MAALGGALDDPDALRAAAAGSLKAFLGSPDPELVRALAGCHVGDDQNESRSRPLARPLTMGDFVAPLLRRGNSADPYEHSFDWLEGTFALSPPWCRRLTQHEKIFEYFRKYRMSR
jgi:hypothetical protein